MIKQDEDKQPQTACFHCGNEVTKQNIVRFDQQDFCCNGCKTVYEIFQQNDLGCYYDFEKNPGTTPNDIQGKYDFLDNHEIVKKLLEFDEDNCHIISLHIPTIHCSSCIWILENLQKLQNGISSSLVNFPKKTVRIQYNPAITSLKSIVYLLSAIGYEPYISLDSLNQPKDTIQRNLLYKIGVAFFSFGNIMLLSFPEYFEVNEFWINQYRDFFRWLIFGLALPPFFYSASIYYVSAYKSLKSGFLNIDVPIALGIVVMFIRSSLDIFFDWGQGFFDSMTGLIFFMLLGKLFQQKTYEFLSFERDYKSYFPIAVSRLLPNKSIENIQVYNIQKGDRLYLRNQELLPVDGILISDKTAIDYSFVTGESVPVTKVSGEKCFAGGKILGNPIEIEVLNSIEQSYLTQLWSNDVFQINKQEQYQTLTNQVSKYFTPVLLIIAFVSFGYWLFIDTKTAFNVFTAILIVACPCALALTAPFTLGNALRILGVKKIYLKNAHVIEQMAKIKTVVFDKTGTITSAQQMKVNENGHFDANTKAEIYQLVSGSNHPLSRQLANHLNQNKTTKIFDYQEVTGQGISGSVNENFYKIGSAQWVGHQEEHQTNKTQVFVSKNNQFLGGFTFQNTYRAHLKEFMTAFASQYQLKILSGDNNGEQATLQKLLPANTPMYFDQKPEDKLQKIKTWQQTHPIMMVGDGLNDAGALAQSNVGLVISENVNVFSPACDGIIDAEKFQLLPKVLLYAKAAIKTIYASFTISILYNIVGLSFAVSGNLSPLVAAIIMPISTITIVSFVTIMTNFYAYKILK